MENASKFSENKRINILHFYDYDYTYLFLFNLSERVWVEASREKISIKHVLIVPTDPICNIQYLTTMSEIYSFLSAWSFQLVLVTVFNTNLYINHPNSIFIS